MKIALIPMVVVIFGLSVSYGQLPDPLEPDSGGETPFIRGPLFDEKHLPPGPPLLLEPPEEGKGEHGKRRAKRREFVRQRFKEEKAELNLLRGEIGEHTQRLKELKKEFSTAQDESEKARITAELHDVVEKLSQYEVMLAKKKAEISRKVYERALDRYIRAEVELEQAKRKSKHRLKRFEKKTGEDAALEPGAPKSKPRRTHPGYTGQPEEGEEPLSDP